MAPSSRIKKQIALNFKGITLPHNGALPDDPCQLNPCIVEAGCHPWPNGTYSCFCIDLFPPDPIHGCERKKIDQPGTEAYNSTNATLASTTTTTDFGLAVSFKIPIAGHKNNKSFHIGHLPHRGQISSWHGSLLIFIATICFLFLCLSLSLFIWRKKVSHLFPRGRRRLQPLPSKGTLAKCIQQYVTNPNYYSNSPDGPLMRILAEYELPEDKVSFLEEIGEGFFGKVYRGIYRKGEGDEIEVAIKVPKENIGSEGKADFDREVEILASFRHPNIVKLIGIINGETSTSMVFEYMSFGDLAELLRSNAPHKQKPQPSTSNNEEISSEGLILSKENLVFIATQIANGMKYLSSQHFVHRDLATRNCLVDKDLIVKISDFGMSRDIYTCDYYKVNGSRMLPVRWMPPESILYGKFTLESDVWSFGVVLWEIFTFGKQPYYGHSNDEVVKLILQGILLIPPEDCPQFIYQLMAGCWKTEVKDRLKFPEIFTELYENCSKEDQDRIPVEEPPKMDEEDVLDMDDYLTPSPCTFPLPIEASLVKDCVTSNGINA